MAGAGQRFVIPNQFTVDANGPRAGAQLFFYATGTTTYQDTYSDSALTIPNTNPVVADSNGQFGNVFLLGSPAYHVVLEDSSGATIWDMDPVGPQISSTGQVPVGTVVSFGGTTAPAGWLLCYGQAISRTTYAALFAVISTTYGAGDGSTTFNLPDCRGRLPLGQDNMGGTAANRVTQAVSGINALNIGAVGGSQLSQADTITASSTITAPTFSISGSASQTPASTPGSGIAGYGVGYTFNPASLSLTQTGSYSVTTTATSGLTGTSQNMPPAIVFPVIIYTGVGG